MTSSRDRNDARRLLMELAEFLQEHYGIDVADAREDPHFCDFLKYVVERPVLMRNGILCQKPIRTSLVDRVHGLATYLREIEVPLQLSDISRDLASKLQLDYTPAQKGVSALLEGDVRRVAQYFGSAQPRHMRFKAILLPVWEMAARPSEIIWRRYPDDVNANRHNGVAIAVPKSKTGRKPEYFEIKHNPDRVLCAVCALHRWVQWLGPRYRGPLFPALDGDNRIRPDTYTVGLFARSLTIALERLRIQGRPYGSYSLRKGRATEATAHGVPLETVQKGLRHKSLAQSIVYIDRNVLFETMRSVHDETASS